MKDDTFEEQMNRHYQLWCDATLLYENWSKQQGLTSNAVLTLCTLLSNKEHCTQKMICEQWGLPKQTVNTILKEFERKEYVTLAAMPSNKRTKNITLTDSGSKYASDVSSALYRLHFYAIEKMGLARMTELNDNFALYLNYFNEAEKVEQAK